MFQPASIVVLSTFTLNNVRLLYLSKIGTPYDAAAGKGTLGKNLTHQVEGNTRVFLDQPLNAFMGTGGLAMRISDFDGDHGLNGSEGLLRMGMIGVLSNGSRPIGTFDAVPRGSAKSELGIGMEGRGVEMARPQRGDRALRRAPFLPPELHGSRSDVYR